MSRDALCLTLITELREHFPEQYFSVYYSRIDETLNFPHIHFPCILASQLRNTHYMFIHINLTHTHIGLDADGRTGPHNNLDYCDPQSIEKIFKFIEIIKTSTTQFTAGASLDLS